MLVYKILFSFNKVVWCDFHIADIEMVGDMQFEAKGKLLIHAFVKADSREEAFSIANNLAEAFSASYSYK